MSLSSAFSRAPELVELVGVATPAAFGSLDEEMSALRGSIGLSARPDVARVRLSGSGAWDLLARVCPADLYLRDSQLRHTLLLRDDGHVLADLHVGCDDDAFLLLAEGLAGAALVAHLAAHAPAGADVELVDLAETHALVGLDGPFAWELLAALEGAETVGLPFSTFFHPRPDTTIFRAGKTGEFGYSFLWPHAESAALWTSLREAGERLGLREVGVTALFHAQLESWFFNVHREGRAADATPIELQLQWRLVGEARDAVGRAALRAHAATHRTVALVGEASLGEGDPITLDGRPIGRVLVAQSSATLALPIGLGLVERPVAHSGIGAFRAGDVRVRTISPPFVNNLSLYVNPQRHSYATRAEIPFRGLRPPRFSAP